MMSLILRRRVSAVSKDEACAQAAATSHMRWPSPLAGEGWGEGVSAIENHEEVRALSPALSRRAGEGAHLRRGS